MIDTTTAYKNAIAADTELSTVEGSFRFIPDGAEEGAVASATDVRSQSDFDQVKTEGETSRFATLEPGRWRLDGTYEVYDPSSGMKTGFMSASLCGSDGSFLTPPRLTYTMDGAYDIVGLTLFFDSAEHATAVTVSYYDAEDTLIASESFADNTEAVWKIDFPSLGVAVIAIDIDAWSEPYRFAKVGGILPGESFLFAATNTISLEYSEHCAPFADEFETPELSITVDNSNHMFDIINPQGFMQYLRQMMRLTAMVGIWASGWELIPMGDMHLYEWPSKQQSETASFTCKPFISFLNNEPLMYQPTTTGTTTAADAAAFVFEQVGLRKFSVDDSLADATVNAFWKYDDNLQTVMQHLAIAVRGWWKLDREGYCRLLPISETTVATIDYDAMYDAPEIEQTPKITRVNVIYWTYNPDDGGWDEHTLLVRAETDDGSQGEDITSAFIPDETTAQAVGEAALAYYAKRLKYGATYRGDPSLEAGDAVQVQNDYGLSNVLITEHTLTWDADNKLIGSFEGVSDA